MTTFLRQYLSNFCHLPFFLFSSNFHQFGLLYSISVFLRGYLKGFLHQILPNNPEVLFVRFNNLYDSRPMALTVSDYSKEDADIVVIERSSNGEKMIIIIKSIIYITHSFLSIIYLPKQFGIRPIRSSASTSSRSEINVFLCDFLVSD